MPPDWGTSYTLGPPPRARATHTHTHTHTPITSLYLVAVCNTQIREGADVVGLDVERLNVSVDGLVTAGAVGEGCSELVVQRIWGR